MVTSTALNAAMKKYVQLIKFPKARGFPKMNSEPEPKAAEPNVVNAVAAPAAPKVKKAVSSGKVIESWELPPKYSRKPFSQEEIEYINAGGPPSK